VGNKPVSVVEAFSSVNGGQNYRLLVRGMRSPHHDSSCVAAVILQGEVISPQILYENAGRKDIVWRKNRGIEK
jgi:hypothetical protein